MDSLSGFVEKIKYRNEENGYSILSVESGGEDYVLVGTFPMISEGEYISAEGHFQLHPTYGEQLAVETYEIKTPEDSASVQRYLSSGAVKGVGEALAKRIVKKFKNDTLRILEEEPERLAEVKGISERLAMEIAGQIEEKRELRRAMLFLSGYGIRMNLAVKIYRRYGDEVYTLLRENPYRIADDLSGVGFQTADEIARRMGVRADAETRIRSAVLYVLRLAVQEGHCYLPTQLLTERLKALLRLEPENLRQLLLDLQMEKRLILRRAPNDAEETRVYLANYDRMELHVAAMLKELDIRETAGHTRAEEQLALLEEEEAGLVLDETQRRAVLAAVQSGLLVITGGPGTGKTTTINAIIRCFEAEGAEILLAAPTGRAAARMTEATGREAKTIHRLLEVTGAPTGDEEGDTGRESWSTVRFDRNKEQPLEADCIIIDEMSMVDLRLFHALLLAVPVGAHLILVGDSNQLPSVGAGNVLRDLIASACLPVAQLTQIYRQAAESDIVVNAHKMMDEEPIDLGKRSKDFLFIRQGSAEGVIQTMLRLITEKLPAYVGADAKSIQLLTPVRRGALGVAGLNPVLQAKLNPPGHGKAEREFPHALFRVGDKLMQIKNNYQRGVYNGDVGILSDINRFSETLTVRFDEGREVEYGFADVEELELAYAVTIHKSQGSEYPAVVIPVFSGPRMLRTRNLIYTAVTRAKKCVVLIGEPSYFYEMVANTKELGRYTGLADRLRELLRQEAEIE